MFTSTTLAETLEANLAKVVVFTRKQCPYCASALALLVGAGVAPVAIDIEDAKPGTKEDLAALGRDNSKLTYPRIFVGGKLIGGADDLKLLHSSGALYGLLGAATVELSGERAKLTPAQELAARRAMVPDPYIEASLADRGILGKSGKLNLPSEITNLYKMEDDGTFTFASTERNKAYLVKPDDAGLRVRDQEAEPKERTAKATIKLDAAGPKRFELDVKLERTQIWGIDFVGTVTVDHPTGESCTVYLPGVLSFDPAGITGDSHSSERIGPSCARMQTGITMAQFYALQRGASPADVDAIQAGSTDIIWWFNGRLAQWKWMRNQLHEACELKLPEVTPYPEFIAQLIAKGEFDATQANRKATLEYLASYKAGAPVPPMEYFLKVNEQGCSCFEKL